MSLILSGNDLLQKGLIDKLAESMFGYCNNICLKSFFDLPKRSAISLLSSNLQTIFVAPDKLKLIWFTSANEILSLLAGEIREKVRSLIFVIYKSLPSYWLILFSAIFLESFCSSNKRPYNVPSSTIGNMLSLEEVRSIFLSSISRYTASLNKINPLGIWSTAFLKSFSLRVVFKSLIVASFSVSEIIDALPLNPPVISPLDLA